MFKGKFYEILVDCIESYIPCLNISLLLCFKLYMLSTYSVLTPFLRGAAFMPAGTDARFGDPPA